MNDRVQKKPIYPNRGYCEHLGNRVVARHAPDQARQYYECEKGHGVVCPCGACKRCDDWVPRTTDDLPELPMVQPPATDRVQLSNRVQTVVNGQPRTFSNLQQQNQFSESVDEGPERIRPHGWSKRKDIALQHAALREQFISNLPSYDEAIAAGHLPPVVAKRGAVLMGENGYEAGIYVAIKMLRRHGFDGPIYVYYRSHAGKLSGRISFLEGVTVVDATPILRSAGRRNLGAWQNKNWLIINAPFEEIVYLDADAYPVANFNSLFDLLDEKKPLIVWPDTPEGDRNLNWEYHGLAGYSDDSYGIIGAHYVLRRRECYRAFSLAAWVDNHADFYYDTKSPRLQWNQYGDQDSVRLALYRLRDDIEPIRVPRNQTRQIVDKSYLVYSPEDSSNVLFVHRHNNKLAPPNSGFRDLPFTSYQLPEEFTVWAYFRDWERRDERTGEIPVGSGPPGWMSESELTLLGEVTRGRKVVELGRFCGLSTSRMTEAKFVDSFDQVDSYFAETELIRLGIIKPVATDKKIEKIEEVSDILNVKFRFYTGDFSIANSVVADHSIDVVFVDGNHDKASVNRDIEIALKLLKPGGVLAFHDWGQASIWPEVTPVVNEYAKKFGWVRFAVADTLACFKTKKE